MKKLLSKIFKKDIEPKEKLMTTEMTINLECLNKQIDYTESEIKSIKSCIEHHQEYLEKYSVRLYSNEQSLIILEKLKTELKQGKQNG